MSLLADQECKKIEFSEMDQVVKNKCKILWPFSLQHLPAALQKHALSGYISLHSTVRGQCHSECHKRSMCVGAVAPPWLFPHFISMNKNYRVIAQWVSLLLYMPQASNIFILTKFLIWHKFFLMQCLQNLHTHIQIQCRCMASTLDFNCNLCMFPACQLDSWHSQSQSQCSLCYFSEFLV